MRNQWQNKFSTKVVSIFMSGFLFIRIYSNKFPLSQNCACENDVGKFKRECMNLKNLLLAKTWDSRLAKCTRLWTVWSEDLLHCINVSGQFRVLINNPDRKSDLLSDWVLQGCKHQHCYHWRLDTRSDTWQTKDRRRTTWRRKLGQVSRPVVAISKECTRQPWNYWNIQTMTNTTKWQ